MTMWMELTLLKWNLESMKLKIMFVGIKTKFKIFSKICLTIFFLFFDLKLLRNNLNYRNEIHKKI